MSDNENKIISDRTQKEWISGCPVQVGRIQLLHKDGGGITARISSAVCGDFKLKEYTADIEYTGVKRQAVGRSESVTLAPGDTSEVDVPFPEAVYAAVIIKSAVYADGRTWGGDGGAIGKIPPDQEIFWQTDPLYETIQLECAGVTSAKYKPDKISGAWRCACGQINLTESKSCGACGCSLEWLESHLERSYLEKRSLEIADKTQRETDKLKKRRERELSDKTKTIALVSAFAAAAVLIILTFTTFIPLGRYSSAVRLADSGEYDEAIAIFSDLGGFRDSREMAANVNYRKAQFLTGLDEVYMTTNAAQPWFSITNDGVLSFKKDSYTGSWNNFIVPDVVDNVVVRELDRNFFINCADMTVVTISDCVEVIGEQCFYNCESLHTINFGKSVTTIMPRAFINCTSLESIEIPDTVVSLGLRAFNNCINLNKVVLGSGVTEIGSYQFSLCLALERITLKSPITSVGEYAFSECSGFTKINCRFPESQWITPTVAEGNDYYYSAQIIFDE